MPQHIDLNADLGEGGLYDAALMKVISSCNIACGGHTGDANTMAAALNLAIQNAVRIGAHPSYPDQDNFGRKTMQIDKDTLGAAITDQVANLAVLANAKEVKLTHLKPHGALYNDAARDAELANLMAVCTLALGPDTQLVGPPGSALEAAARQMGLRFVGEGFIDRAYDDDGSLTPREKPGAIIQSVEARLQQALSQVRHSEALTHTGKTIAMPVETLCLHGDAEDADQTARSLFAALTEAGIAVQAPK